jgi:hypothetical protein
LFVLALLSTKLLGLLFVDITSSGDWPGVTFDRFVLIEALAELVVEIERLLLGLSDCLPIMAVVGGWRFNKWHWLLPRWASVPHGCLAVTSMYTPVPRRRKVVRSIR